jgi:hypothetical protein
MGPAYVSTNSELRTDLDHKQAAGEISEQTAEAFLDLYEFAIELGDRVTIGGAKNANFQLKVEAHQSTSATDPSVFTANVTGEI